MTATDATPAALEQSYQAHSQKKVRTFITPEGVDLQLRIGSSGARFAALMIDMMIMTFAMILFFWIMVSQLHVIRDDIAGSFLGLGIFVIRNFYFIWFELGPRAATPGKRMVKLRVVARDGGRLTAGAVIARNFIRDLELFLPLTMAVMALDDGSDLSGWTASAGLLWALCLSLFLLFNKDRMRFGDIIAGTWVVESARRKIAKDLVRASEVQPTSDAWDFTPAELSLYGEFELKELEQVIRHGNNDLRRDVADTIRAKMGRPLVGEDDAFLLAYYAALKAHLERGMLFGKRRASKYDTATER